MLYVNIFTLKSAVNAGLYDTTTALRNLCYTAKEKSYVSISLKNAI